MRFAVGIAALLLASCAGGAVQQDASSAGATGAGNAPRYDLLIRGGTIVDGSGGAPYVGDVAISGEDIAAVGPDLAGTAAATIDAGGMTVAPGFINMLSWAPETLIEDGAGESDIRQGVTTEIFGEGWSFGPVNETSQTYMTDGQGDIRYDVTWDSLADFLNMLEAKGVAPNVASFVGATTARMYVIGSDDVDPSPEQLREMQNLVRTAMNEGALGVGSSLIYAPATFAETPELIALAKASADCGGMYISHIRNESDHLMDAVEEVITIARESGGPAEIYHLKQAGKSNWVKLDDVIARVEQARAEGLRITANMYTYTAGATGLDAAMPTWVQAGGLDEWIERLKDPATRAKVIAEMREKPQGYDNLYWHAGPDKTLLLQFKSEALKPLTGKTVAEVAKMRGVSPEDAIVDLVIEDGSRVGTAYFLMSEENVARQTTLPWMSFGSDEGAPAPRGVFLKSNVHPRAYGTFARLLGKYVRDEKMLPIEEAVRKLAAMPAEHLGLTDRGMLKAGKKADVVIFDAATIADRATFEKPHQFAVGMRDVIVNGTPVLRGGEMTGARPGDALEGPGTGRCPAQ